jgi:hypothetical protein
VKWAPRTVVMFDNRSTIRKIQETVWRNNPANWNHRFCYSRLYRWRA